MAVSTFGGKFTAAEIESAMLNPRADILQLSDCIASEDTEVMLESYLEKEIDGHREENNELSPGGILDEETIARGLSNLGRSADGCHQVYLNVTIPGFSLTDISVLSNYEQLQKVEIPYNDITDLSPLGKLKYLLFLDASHNKIKKLLDFEPPFNLQEVNLSWNKIQDMGDLSAYCFLKKLILNNNEITCISGLQKCKRLKHLSLSNNHISEIKGLSDLPIRHLYLNKNRIKDLKNLETMKFLKKLYLSGNCVRSLYGLDKVTMLESVDLEANAVIDIVEMQHLRHAKNLQELNLLRNPIQALPDYRLCILYRLKGLIILDRHHVLEQEKVAAINMIDPPMEIVAANDHIMNVVYSFLQPSTLWHSTLPNIKTPYPMLVLVGPQGSGKKYMCIKLLEEFGEYFGHGISHTTRQPRLGEVAGKDYHFISQEDFDADIKMGAFIQTCLYNHSWYGLQMAAIENVALEGLACVVHMELEGVMTLKDTYFEPRYVLIAPLDKEAHERRLKERNFQTEDEINMILARSDMYIKQNQNHPGFFDMMICSDDITEAYTQLRKLVMEYLGISSTTSVCSMPPEDVVDVYEVKETTPVITGTTLSHRRKSGTWSKASIPESMSQPDSSTAGSVLLAQGIVEEESIKRRYSIAKQIVTGYKPQLTEQLLLQYPRSVPQNLDKETKGQRAHSAPTNQRGQEIDHAEIRMPDSPDSSDDEHSRIKSSALDSESRLPRSQDNKVNRNANFMGVLPTEKVDPLVLIDEQSYHSFSLKHPPDSFPSSPSRPDSKCSVTLPGSDRYSVLPPIHNSAA